MDKQRARFILQSCRPDRRDADDPRFAEAWAAAQSDGELAARLAQDRALDDALAAKLRSAPVPRSLPARVLAGVELRAASDRRRRVLGLALAACIALLLSLAGAWFVKARAAVSFASYRQEMVGRLEGRIQLSFTSQSVAELQQWLADKRGVDNLAIPGALQDSPAIGCRTWTWNERPAGLICFLVNGTEPVHLLVISREAVPRAPQGPAPQFTEVNGWTTACWARDGNVYLLAGRMDRAALGRLL